MFTSEDNGEKGESHPCHNDKVKNRTKWSKFFKENPNIRTKSLNGLIWDGKM